MARASSRRRAYEATSVAVTKSREEIDKILRNWGVSGIQWEDDFDNNMVVLRFRWTREEVQYVVRYRLAIDSEEMLREKAIDKRSNRFSEKKYERLVGDRGKREHRLLAAFLKNTFEAVEQGIMVAEAVFLPWLEDAEGITVFERIEPAMPRLASAGLPKALQSAEDDD